MQAGNPEGWQGIVRAAETGRDNLEAIRDCQQAAIEAKEPVRCTININ